MRQVLEPETPFSHLDQSLSAAGWARVRTPGLLPPLRDAEPEQARFEKGQAALIYSFNPVLDLRVLEGDPDCELPVTDAAQVADWLAAEDPVTRARGCLAAAELALHHLSGTVAEVAATLPDALQPAGQAALRRLAPLPAGDPRGLFDALPRILKEQALRQLLIDAPDKAAALVPQCWADGPDLALTAMIAAARFGLVDQARNIRQSDPAAAGRGRREKDTLKALRLACLDTLAGNRPPGDGSPKDRFWSALLRPVNPVDDETLLIWALTHPLPDIQPTDQNEDWAVIPSCPHWIGHAAGKGRANPLRHWTPPAPFRIARHPIGGAAPADAVATDEPQALLAALSAEHGTQMRLPSLSEWEAALRGPDGRWRPWGIDRTAPDPAMSPWGVFWSGAPEWALVGETRVLCGTDPSGRVSYVQDATPGSIAVVRPCAEH